MEAERQLLLVRANAESAVADIYLPNMEKIPINPPIDEPIKTSWKSAKTTAAIINAKKLLKTAPKKRPPGVLVVSPFLGVLVR